MDGGDPSQDVGREIVERHRFFERWFNGVAGEAEFAANLSRFDPAFRRVAPDGRETWFADLVASLRNGRAVDAQDPVAIAVEDVRVLWREGQGVLAAYLEVQTRGARTTRRRSTAFFCVDEAGKILWRHVQETWMDEAGRAGAPSRQQGDDMR